jgi:putative inorganic carbon (HCO3(-)) transporter
MVQVKAQERDKLAFGLLVIFAVVMYAVPSEWIAWTAPLRLALVTSALASSLMVLRRFGQRERIVMDGARGWALALFVLLATASIQWSLYPEASKAQVSDLFKSLAIYLTMVNLVTTPRRLLVMCLAMIAASIVTSVGVINWYNAGIDLVEGFRGRWVGMYADPNRMAMSVGIIIPLAVALFVRKESSLLVRCTCAVAVVVAMIAIVFSHSRGGFLGLAAAMMVWTLREKRLAQTVVVALLAIGMVVFAPKSFWNRTETVSHFEEDASAMGRVYAWHVASAISMDRPILGVGVGTFMHVWPLYAPPEAHQTHAAHNVFLQVIAELGLLGTALFLVFVGGGTGGAFEASSHREIGWLARGIAASVVGYLICSLFAGFLASPHLFVLMGLAACAQRIASTTGSTALVLTREDRPPAPQTVVA